MSTIRLGKGNPEVKRKKSKMSVWLFRVTTPCAFLAVWCDDRGTDLNPLVTIVTPRIP